MLNNNNNYNVVAFDAEDGEFEFFKDVESAKEWLMERDFTYISDEWDSGESFIAKITHRSGVENRILKAEVSEEEWKGKFDDEGTVDPEECDWLGDPAILETE